MEVNMDKEQNQNNKTMPGMCNCGYGRRNFWLRRLVAVIILIVVFCLGMAMGRFQGHFGQRGNMMMRAGYGHRMGTMPSHMMIPGSVMQGQPATTTPAK